jgi:uncharacterized OsmC-like protein
MMEISIRHTGKVRFEVAARGHVLVCDQPAENGGADEGITPPELFLASLGTCAGFYAAAYLKKKGLEREGLTVRVTADKAKAPARLDDFRIEVDVPGPLSEADCAGIDDAVHRCLIHNTLMQTPKIAIAVNVAEMLIQA